MKLDDLIAEAKAEQPKAVRDLDWEKIEARVLADVRSASRETSKVSPLRKYLRPATVALTLAATLVIYARRHAAEHPTPEQAEQHAAVVRAQRDEASSLTSGALRIDATAIAPGQVVRTGDALSVANGRATLERMQSATSTVKAVSWLLESDDGDAALARVAAAGQQGVGPATPLVLDIEHGAIEAQVTPVKEGEAFAVDVIAKTGIIRVAVHGTHLRVSRTGDRVVVDLTEGVIAIGNAPGDGKSRTIGTSISAPAHVELDANDLGSLKVEHGNVRPPVQLGDHVVEFPLPAPPVDTDVNPSPTIAVAPPVRPVVPTPIVEAPKPALSPREAIPAAVHACAIKHRSAEQVRTTLTSKLDLTVGDDGVPTLAQFTPPLAPDIQTCTAEAIYKMKLDETGKIAVPIDVTY